MKQILYYLFLISGLVPATVLLFLSLYSLMNLLGDFELTFEYTLILLSLILGISGYVGLVRLLINPAYKSDLITILLLLSGFLGTIIFLIIEGSEIFLRWFFSFEEPFEWFLFVWPNIVALFFAIILIFKQRQTKRYNHFNTQKTLP